MVSQARIEIVANPAKTNVDRCRRGIGEMLPTHTVPRLAPMGVPQARRKAHRLRSRLLTKVDVRPKSRRSRPAACGRLQPVTDTPERVNPVFVTHSYSNSSKL